MIRERHSIDSQGALHPLRLGRFTASSAGKLFMGKSTIGYSEAVTSIAFERFTGKRPEGGFEGNFWTARGHDLEPFAVEQYEIDTFTTVNPGGFWTCGEWWGASPDGEIDSDGLFEGKAPKFTTHISYLQAGVLPDAYKWQIPMQLLVTDRAWCDFQSYHPDLPTFLIRIARDEKTETALVKELNIAREKAEQIIETLRNNYA